MQTSFKYRETVSNDHPALYVMWQATPGITIRNADTFEGFVSFLKRNPGLSFVVENQGQIVGGILGGHDGRFGSIHHLVVLPEFRKQGIGNHLVELSLARIESAGIEKVHIFINKDNPGGNKFWTNKGWVERVELTMASYTF